MVEKKTIAIGGELRPIHYGFAALAEWCDLTGDNMSMSAAIQLIYCGLRHGARRSKEEFNYSIDDVADWIDEEGMDIFTDAMAIFADAMVKINPSKKKKKK